MLGEASLRLSGLTTVLNLLLKNLRGCAMKRKRRFNLLNPADQCRAVTSKDSTISAGIAFRMPSYSPINGIHCPHR